MATATKKARAATSLTRAAPLARSFLTYPDNGGNYHWEIVDASGETLASREASLLRMMPSTPQAIYTRVPPRRALSHTWPRAPGRAAA